MTKRKKVDEEDEIELAGEGEVAETVEDVVAPETHVCLDGAYTQHPDAASHPRTLVVGGVNYEHTDTDAAGVWLYRRM